MAQVIQVFGSLFILIPFVAAQRGRLSTDSRRYLWLNVIGSGILAVLAAIESQYGFLLLEVCWGLVAAASLVKSFRDGQSLHQSR